MDITNEDYYDDGYSKGFRDGIEAEKQYIIEELKTTCKKLSKEEILKYLEEICYEFE